LIRQQEQRVAKAALPTRDLLRQLLATCDFSAIGCRDRALLLFGFVGALRRSELVALQVPHVADVAGGLTLQIWRRHTDLARQRVEISLPRGNQIATCPVRAFHAWQRVAQRKAGPLICAISADGRIGDAPLHVDAVRRILGDRIALSGIIIPAFDTLGARDCFMRRSGWSTLALS
jgi:integrase